MIDTKKAKENSEFINKMFKKLSMIDQAHVRGYIAGLLAHSDKESKSA